MTSAKAILAVDRARVVMRRGLHGTPGAARLPEAGRNADNLSVGGTIVNLCSPIVKRWVAHE